MTNDKFTLQRDRRLVLEDEKNRIIDLRDFHQQPPDVGIYDEPVRYFKANKQWCKFIFGWLTWMQSVSFWKDAEDSNYHAIQQILIFEEGINGTILMNPDEFRDALDAGMYSAINKLARQIVSGRYTDIAVDEDGNVTQPSEATGDANLPEDDPATPALDEQQAAKAGGCIAVVAGYNSIWADMDAWAQAALANGTIVFRLMQKYQMVSQELTEGFVSVYLTQYPTSHINFYTETLSEMLFCGGDNFKNTVADYVIESITLELQGIAFALNNALADEQITDWFNYGSKVASTDYIGYGCTPIAVEEFELDMSTSSNVQYVTNGIWKANHRFLIEVSGTFQDADAPTIQKDGMYSLNTVTGIKTFEPLNFNLNGTIQEPAQINIPYSPTHAYAFTLNRLGLGDAPRTIAKAIGAGYAFGNITGILSLKITDLGEYAS